MVLGGNYVSSFIAGVLSGAGVTYVLTTRRRRQEIIHRRAVPLQARSIGRVELPRLANSTRQFGSPPVPDQVVKERVRAQLNRAVPQSGSISVAVTNGQVTLSGQVAEMELVSAVNAVQSIEGVRAVANRMKIVGTHEATSGHIARPHRSIS